MSAVAATPFPSLVLRLPGLPPNQNHYVRHGAHAHRLTAQAKAWKDDLAMTALVQCGADAIREAFDWPFYAVTVLITMPPARAGDLDNYAKVPLDALQRAGILHNDRAVRRLTLEREDGCELHTEITVSPFPTA